MLTAGGPAHCASLASARLLRLPTAVHQRSCLLTQPFRSARLRLPFSLSLSRLLPALATRLPSPAAMDGLVDTVVSTAFKDPVRVRLLLVAP